MLAKRTISRQQKFEVKFKQSAQSQHMRQTDRSRDHHILRLKIFHLYLAHKKMKKQKNIFGSSISSDDSLDYYLR